MSGSQTLKLLVDGQERLTEKVSAWSDRQRAPEEDDDAEDLAYFISGDAVASSEDEEAEYAGTETSGLTQAVINGDGDRLAVVAQKSDGQRLLVGPAGGLEPVEKFSSESLHDPQWLDDDTLLVIDAGQPVTVNINSGKRHKISIEDGNGAVSELALSPDSRRLAYIADGRTWVSTVLPSEGSARKLGDPVPVAEEVSDVGDVGWSRETHLLMIGSVPGDKAWLWEASIDGAYLETPPGASEDTSRADALAVRCQPATIHSDLPGEPILLEINGIINRVYTEISPVRVGDEDAAGFAPFTASLTPAETRVRGVARRAVVST
ncbi:MAG: LpqB family beta-propeller domain-containing protein [Stackebrandtia sp.]